VAVRSSREDPERQRGVCAATRVYLDAVSRIHGVGAVDSLVKSLEVLMVTEPLIIKSCGLTSRVPMTLYMKVIDAECQTFVHMLCETCSSVDVVLTLRHNDPDVAAVRGFARVITTFATAAIFRAIANSRCTRDDSVVIAANVVRLMDREEVWKAWDTGDGAYGKVIDVALSLGNINILDHLLVRERLYTKTSRRQFHLIHRSSPIVASFTAKEFAIASGTDWKPGKYMASMATAEDVMSLIRVIIEHVPPSKKTKVAAACAYVFAASHPSVLASGAQLAAKKKLPLTSLFLGLGASCTGEYESPYTSAMEQADTSLDVYDVLEKYGHDDDVMPLTDTEFADIVRRSENASRQTSPDPEFADMSSSSWSRPATRVIIDPDPPHVFGRCPLRADCLMMIKGTSFEVDESQERVVVQCSGTCKKVYYHWACYPKCTVQRPDRCGGECLGSQRSWTSMSKDPNAACVTPGCDGRIVFAAREGGTAPRILVPSRKKM
jgi:hypothetical protein